MTQEEKSILLQDLCARLPYGVQVLADIDKTFDGGIIGKVVGVNLESGLVYLEGVLTPFLPDEIKPYFRPLSSMTEEEKEERNKFVKSMVDNKGYTHYIVFPHDSTDYTDWLNARIFDYRGLISKGLALPALEGMYNLKTNNYGNICTY